MSRMNFDPDVSKWNMPELRWTYGYPFALGIMALVICAELLYFWWRGWFRF
jgi:magnesium transporter